ncbi:hypothetical protein ACO22_00212 [Paracoccidioides brasiliensis]|uniref:Uncharacterized protein n=1 Tax=Paracoccidioides brasiliensis TaxID=121759 RepID=A0A1D2JPS1_PARBR|nr:hypothetical protein ACO22_00212 [Paracoccidioides brasiliensis]
MVRCACASKVLRILGQMTLKALKALKARRWAYVKAAWPANQVRVISPSLLEKDETKRYPRAMKVTD